MNEMSQKADIQSPIVDLMQLAICSRGIVSNENCTGKEVRLREREREREPERDNREYVKSPKSKERVSKNELKQKNLYHGN